LRKMVRRTGSLHPLPNDKRPFLKGTHPLPS
jgi:hypothetical protein